MMTSQCKMKSRKSNPISGVWKSKKSVTEDKYFEGWYYKQQDAKNAFAVIPAFHGKKASIQIITDKKSYQFDFGEDYACFYQSKELYAIRIGKSLFFKGGFLLSIHQDHLQINASVEHGMLCKPNKSMMGPFLHVPFVPCCHEVFSMLHHISANLDIKDDRNKLHLVYRMNHGLGYMEGDKGHSFPNRYFWTQASFIKHPLSSIMIAVAYLTPGKKNSGTLPGFWGCTCFFMYRGKEYHVATYLGARVTKMTKRKVSIRQGNLVLEVDILNAGTSKHLTAPVNGAMSRTIVESVDAIIRYRLYITGKKVFDITGNPAGCELEY